MIFETQKSNSHWRDGLYGFQLTDKLLEDNTVTAIDNGHR